MSGFVLKLIALAAMIIDHAGLTLSNVVDANILRGIGRMAFPIYVFFIAEGCRKTRSVWRYFLRLAAFAVISEIPYDIFSGNIHSMNSVSQMIFSDLSSQNVFFTLALGVLAIIIARRYDSGSSAIFVPLGAAAALAMGDLFNTDYGSAGAFFILWTYLAAPKEDGREHAIFNAERLPQALVLVVLSFYFYIYKFLDGEFLYSQLRYAAAAQTDVLTKINMYLNIASKSATSFSRMLFLFGSIPAVLILFYNGKRGRSLKWAFYAAYPIHQALLALVWFFVIYPMIFSA